MFNSKKQIYTLFYFLVFSFLLPLNGQSVKEEISETIEKSGGVYYTYHFQNTKQTAPPKGYKPFYISHYGRHGSRWMTKDAQYQKVLDVFNAANENDVLSEYGKEIYVKVKLVAEDAIGKHAGDLSPLGAKQHAEIATRMYRSFPSVFKGAKAVNTYATIVPRCILSMGSFNRTLLGINPKLQIKAEANMRTSTFLNFPEYNPLINKEYQYIKSNNNAEWRKIQKEFVQEKINPDRIKTLLFNGNSYSQNGVDGTDLVIALYHMASNLQNVDLDVSLYDIFNKDELYYLWLVENYRFYASYGSSPMNKEYPVFYATILLQNVIDLAESSIKNKNVAADLRFGHDTAFMPFLALLQIENCYGVETDLEKIGDVWQSYRISPMAANLQFVFYQKKKTDEILVKILHNEQEVSVPIESEIFPYYRWSELKTFFKKRISDYNAQFLN